MKKNGAIKQKIYEIRRSKGISQEKMANLISVALNSYRKLERGKTNLVNEKLWDIANALNVSVKELVLEDDILTGTSLADMERKRYQAKINSLEEEIATLKQCVTLLNEKNESYIKNRGSAYQ
ncbi:MAG: helix-turn-helix transcriptional regulator [Bacteroidales bacterium]|jgi:transcriptional regulator with XRE-family HTH domain|nr:helix-turn-helix transcriptional regulator [Bacteroidales bacterium]